MERMGSGMTNTNMGGHGGKVEQYFAAEPTSEDVRRRLHIMLRDHTADVEVSNGVFSGNRLDLGTSVLLKRVPEPAQEGTFLDLGCGWGPIALTMAFESPKADVWALDVNERALELTKRNAEINGIGTIHAATADEIPHDLTFDLIWSHWQGGLARAADGVASAIECGRCRISGSAEESGLRFVDSVACHATWRRI